MPWQPRPEMNGGGGSPYGSYTPYSPWERQHWTPPEEPQYYGATAPHSPWELAFTTGWGSPYWGQQPSADSAPTGAPPAGAGGTGGAAQQPWTTGAPGPGGGPPPDPGLPPWEGGIPAGEWWGMESALPWTEWGQTPWAGVPEGREAEAQTWLNTIMPWYQQQMAWQQFQEQMGWTRERFGAEHGWERERFGEEMQWAQAQQDWQTRQQELQRALDRELTNVQAFGRRWKPQTRWM